MATGYGVYVYITYGYRAIFVPTVGGTDRDKPVRRLRGDCTEIVQFQCGLRKLSMEIVRSPCGFRAEAVRRYGDGSLDA